MVEIEYRWSKNCCFRVIPYNNLGFSYFLISEYKSVIKVDLEAGGGAEIGVLNLLANPNLVEIATWLKNYKK